MAAQDDLFYEGALEATVYWNPEAAYRVDANTPGSQMAVTVSGLAATESGDLLQVGKYVLDSEGEPFAGIWDVAALTWTADITQEDGVLKFSKAADTSVEVDFDSLAANGFKPYYQDQHRYDFVWNSSGHHFQFGTGGNSYRRFTASGNYGTLNFAAVRQGSTRNPNAADWARYSAELESLVMPRWVVGAGRYQYSQTTGNAVPMYIFVFLDGSMLTYGEQDGSNFPQNNPGLKARWRRAVGIDGSKAAQNLFAVDVAGDPRLTDTIDGLENRWLYTRPGSLEAKPWPSNCGSNCGRGAPSQTPQELFANYVGERGYVNIGVRDTAPLASELEGMFVGQDADGPLGILGTWSLTGGGFGLDSARGTIRGAFGAEIQP